MGNQNIIKDGLKTPHYMMGCFENQLLVQKYAITLKVLRIRRAWRNDYTSWKTVLDGIEVGSQIEKNRHANK
jgi:hypothetical protein